MHKNNNLEHFFSTIANTIQEGVQTVTSTVSGLANSTSQTVQTTLETVRAIARESGIDVSSVDEILNNSMNGSNIEVKIGEGGLSSLLGQSNSFSLVSVHIHQAEVQNSSDAKNTGGSYGF